MKQTYKDAMIYNELEQNVSSFAQISKISALKSMMGLFSNNYNCLFLEISNQISFLVLKVYFH